MGNPTYSYDAGYLSYLPILNRWTKVKGGAIQ